MDIFVCVNQLLPINDRVIVNSIYHLLLGIYQMMLPLTQILNSLHTLKNTATASVQSLHRDFGQEQSSIFKEVSHAKIKRRTVWSDLDYFEEPFLE